MSIYESYLRSGTIYFAFTIIGCSILLYIVPGNTPSRSRLKNNLTSSFDTLSSILIGIHDTDGAFLRGSHSTIKRVAILRPLHMQASVIDSFLLWKKFLPCELTKENKPKVDILPSHLIPILIFEEIQNRFFLFSKQRKATAVKLIAEITVGCNVLTIFT